MSLLNADPEITAARAAVQADLERQSVALRRATESLAAASEDLIRRDAAAVSARLQLESAIVMAAGQKELEREMVRYTAKMTAMRESVVATLRAQSRQMREAAQLAAMAATSMNRPSPN